MGHTRALVTIRTVGGSMVYINNSQLESEFLQLLSGDGQTIDNDIQRPADTVATSMQMQKVYRQHRWPTISLVGNSIVGSLTNSKGKQLGHARVEAQYCSRPVFFCFPKFRG